MKTFYAFITADTQLAPTGDSVRFNSQVVGGSYSNSLEREPERVLIDVQMGYILLQKAEEDFGVGIVKKIIDN